MSAPSPPSSPSSPAEDINVLYLGSTPADGKPPSDDNSIGVAAIKADGKHPSDDVNSNSIHIAAINTTPVNINLVNLDSTPADGKPAHEDNISRHHRHNLEDSSILPSLPTLPNINDHDYDYEISSSSAKERHRQNFNKQVFTLNSITLTVEKDPGRTSMTLTSARWNEIVHTLLNWGPRDEEGN
jgi:hypothetical protein